MSAYEYNLYCAYINSTESILITWNIQSGGAGSLNNWNYSTYIALIDNTIEDIILRSLYLQSKMPFAIPF